jgi:hypothetical protein
MGERLAASLHGNLRCRSAEKAEQALKQIIASGHNLEDGSIFDCSTCWQAVIEYQRRGVVSMPAKAPRHPEFW